MENQEIKLPITLINSILQYLATRPYAEVAQLIAEIHNQSVAVPEDA